MCVLNCYADCHYAKCHYPERRGAQKHYLLYKAWLPGLLEVDLKESLSMRVDGFAGVAAKVLKIQGGDDKVTPRAMPDNLETIKKFTL